MPVLKVSGAEHPYQPKSLDIIFVVDHSGSMNGNDKERLALEMIKAFIDTGINEETRIGYVAYNDQILASTKPISMGQEADRETLKSLISQTQYKGNTDIGLALKHAETIIDYDSGRDTVVFLLSDGETDLRQSTTGRTKEVSDSDVAQVAANFNQKQIPIYTIAFGESFSGSRDVLGAISAGTNGLAYTANGPNGLMEIFYEIVKKHTDIFVIPIGKGVYANGNQSINYTLEHTYFDQASCLLISSEKVSEVRLYRNDQQADTKQLGYYTVGNIGSAINEKVKVSLEFYTKENQEQRIYLICKRDLYPVIDIAASAEKKDPIPFTIKFLYDDKQLYEAFEGNVVVYKLMDGVKEKIAEYSIQGKNGELGGTIIIDEKGDYEAEISIRDSYQEFDFQTVNLRITNSIPQGSFEKELNYSIFDGHTTFDLDQYFTDKENRSLTYEIEQLSSNSIKAVIEENILSLDAVKAGKTEMEFSVTNEDGEKISVNFLVIIVPIWRYYFGLIAGGTIVTIAIICFLLRNRKKQKKLIPLLPKAEYDFSGKINGYFTKTPDDEDIMPLTFALYQIKERSFSIGRFFEDLLDPELILELNRIYITPGNDRTLLLSHNSSLPLMIGNSILCKNTAYRMNYGDILYISLEEGKYELELHYVSAMK